MKLDPEFARAYNNRGAAWREKGDRARALQDYAAAVRLDPSDSTAADNHREITLELERLRTLTSQKNLASFNCATAKRQVEKKLCADPGLAQLDRNINEVFLRVIASAESDSHRAALALTQQQRNFIDLSVWSERKLIDYIDMVRAHICRQSPGKMKLEVVE